MNWYYYSYLICFSLPVGSVSVRWCQWCSLECECELVGVRCSISVSVVNYLTPFD